MKTQVFSFICIIFMLNTGQCFNILALFNVPSKSHAILGIKLAEGLTKRGHHVTLATAYNTAMENCTNINLKKLEDFKEKMQKSMLGPKANPIQSFLRMMKFFKGVNTIFWEEPAIQKIIAEKPKYDLVIVDSLYNDGVLGIPYHLGVPSILFNNVGPSTLSNSYVANPNMVYVSNQVVGMPTNTFWGRLLSVTANTVRDFSINYVMDSFQQGLMNKYLPNAPPIQDLKKNVSLMFFNSHYSIEPARPYLPNMVQIGGYHLQDEKELPEDIKNYLDSAKHGAILFSLGSNVLISSIPEKKLESIFKVLGEMAPMKVLFKSEMEHKNVPKNIMVTSWLPQVEILGHPNTKVFISHGGMGGITEAVYHGVPILGIPFFGDQLMFIEEAQTAGYAEVLRFQNLDEEIFRTKLKEVRDNPKYRENAKKRSALIKEQPVKPLEIAAFWVEHIVRFGGGDHLKNAGMDLAWYQLYMIDIYVFYTVILCLALIVNYYVLKFSIKLGKRLIYGENIRAKPQ